MTKPKQYPTWQTGINITQNKQIEVIAEDIVLDDNLDNIDLDVIETKLTKARTQLILDKPFLGNLVLRLPLKPAQSWCRTSATDAKNFYYNPSFIAKLTPTQTKFVLVHEALHCALTHFIRRGHRQKHRWDLACDFAINPLLIKEGFQPPLDVPIFKEYTGMFAEEIYPMIEDKLNNEPMDQHLYDDKPNKDNQNSNAGIKEDDLQDKTDNQDKQGDSNNNNPSKQDNKQQGTQANKPSEKNKNNNNLDQNNKLVPQPAPLSPDDAQTLASQWQRHLASSAQLAKQSGKLGDDWLKLVDFFLQPQVSWRALLAQYISTRARNDFSYYRTSRREGDAIMPSLRSEHINIAIAIDTSGSIKQKDVDEFVSEIDNIKAILSASITLFACDDKLNPDCPWIYQAWQTLEFPSSLGGGKGTNFTPVFDYLNKQNNSLDCLIYFTDALGVFPDYEPNYPVIWLIKGKTPIPWGQRIQLND